jgi:hypothetical protein
MKGEKKEFSSTNNGWTWKCSGAEGGVDAACSATKKAIDPAARCGSADKGEVENPPAGSGLCAVGAPSTVTLVNGKFQWSCRSGASTVACAATKKKVDPAPMCGGADKSVVENPPAGAALCSVGSASGVTLVNGQYEWTCKSGAATKSCSATKKKVPQAVNGQCGGVNGGKSATKPAPVCVRGAGTPVVESKTGWGWTCVGENGGSTARCAASKK